MTETWDFIIFRQLKSFSLPCIQTYFTASVYNTMVSCQSLFSCPVPVNLMSRLLLLLYETH